MILSVRTSKLCPKDITDQNQTKSVLNRWPQSAPRPASIIHIQHTTSTLNQYWKQPTETQILDKLNIEVTARKPLKTWNSLLALMAQSRITFIRIAYTYEMTQCYCALASLYAFLQLKVVIWPPSQQRHVCCNLLESWRVFLEQTTFRFRINHYSNHVTWYSISFLRWSMVVAPSVCSTWVTGCLAPNLALALLSRAQVVFVCQYLSSKPQITKLFLPSSRSAFEWAFRKAADNGRIEYD